MHWNRSIGRGSLSLPGGDFMIRTRKSFSKEDKSHVREFELRVDRHTRKFTPSPSFSPPLISENIFYFFWSTRKPYSFAITLLLCPSFFPGQSSKVSKAQSRRKKHKKYCKHMPSEKTWAWPATTLEKRLLNPAQ